MIHSLAGRLLWLAILLILPSIAGVGCARKTNLLQTLPDKLILYSLDGPDDVQFGPTNEKEFHGYRVLGRIEVTDRKRIEEIVAAFNRGIADSDGSVASCFYPRHAIRAHYGERLEDYVICFQCLNIAKYNGEKITSIPTADSGKATLNAILREEKIPLAKEK